MMLCMAFKTFFPSSRHTTPWVRGNDHTGQRRKMPGFSTQLANDRLCRTLTELVETVASGGQPSDKTLQWISSKLDPERRKKLVDWGLIDPARLIIGQPLPTHLEAWQVFMKNSGLTPKHVHQEHLRAKAIIEACEVVNFTDLRPELVLAKSMELRGLNQWSASTHRGYLVAVKEFANWMVKIGRSGQNPLLALDIPTVREEDTTAAIALSAEQQAILVTGVISQPERNRMPGLERSLLYRLAIYTGWRASPLMELRRMHCHTEEDKPWIEAPGGGRKRRTSLPLTDVDLVQALREHVSLKLPEAHVFSGKRRVDQLADLLQRDCAALGLPHIKFHDLRHTQATNLMRAGVHPRVAQEILGHKQMSTTMRVYTHAGWDDQAEALKSVAPSVARPEPKEAKKAQDA